MWRRLLHWGACISVALIGLISFIGLTTFHQSSWSPQKEWRAHKQLITSIAFSPDGKFLVSGSLDKTVKVWRVKDEHLERLFQHTHWVNSVAFSPDGQLLAVGCWDGVIRLWRIKNGKIIRELKGHQDIVTIVAFSSQNLASGGRDGIIKFWQIGQWKSVRTIKVNKGIINSITFSPNEQILASGSSDGTVKIWDVLDGKLLNTLNIKSLVLCTIFSNDGSLLAVSLGAPDNKIMIWQVINGSIRLKFVLRDHRGPVRSVVFSPDSQLLASTGTGDFTVRLWKVSEGKTVQQYSTPGAFMYRLAYQLERLTRLPLRQILKVQTPPWAMCLAFSPDGKFLAAGFTDGSLKLWRVK